MARRHEEMFFSELLGSKVRARLLRFLFRNADKLHDINDITGKVGESRMRIEKEIRSFVRVGLIKAKSVFVSEENGEKHFSLKKRTGKKKKVFLLDHTFTYYPELIALFTKSFPEEKAKLMEMINPLGRVKFVVTAGVFRKGENRGNRCDLLIVGDELKRNKVEEVAKRIEESLGQQISYTLMSTQEFMYRYDIYDKFIRDILDYPHDKIINKLSI